MSNASKPGRIHRVRGGRWRGVGVLTAACLVSTACGSRLSDQELLAVSHSGTPTADRTAAVHTGVAAEPAERAVVETESARRIEPAPSPAPEPATRTAGSELSASSPAGIRSGGPPSAAPQAAGEPVAPARSHKRNVADIAPGREPSETAPAPAGAAAQGPTSDGSPLKLGTIGTFTGVLGAAMMPGLQAARAWTGYINAKGGLAGHPVQLVVADDKGDPNQAVSLVRRLVEEDRVLALYGAMMPATAQSILPYLNERQMPVVGTCACMNAVATSPMVFNTGASDKSGVTWGHIAGIFTGTDKREVAVLYCREAVTCTEYRNGVKQYEGHQGMRIVYEAQISLVQPDFTSEVLAARNAGAEIIVSIAENPTTIRIARSARRQSYPVIMSTAQGGDDSRFIPDGGSDIEDTVFSSPVAHWATSELMADYREAMRRYVSGGSLGSLGSPIWVAGKMFERLAQSFPPRPATADVLEALWGVKDETLGGLIAPTTFVKGAPDNDRTNTCVVPLAVQDAKPVPTNGGPEGFACAPA